jgi:cytochrome P450
MSNLLLAIVVSIVLLLVHRSVVKSFFSPIRHLPAPTQGPAHKRLFVEPNADQLVVWARELPNQGFIRYHGILNIQKVLVTDPVIVHEILAARPYSFIKPPPISKIIRSLLGNGLVVVEGDAHKNQKKALQPAFKIRNIKDFYHVFENKTKELVSTLLANINTKVGQDSSSTMDLGTKLNAATLDIITLASLA